jgi:phosphonate transport system permease protein
MRLTLGCVVRVSRATEVKPPASTVLGVVGAGGIGQELKNSVDLLDFARLFTIILIILAMVTVIDQFSAWLRRRLV